MGAGGLAVVQVLKPELQVTPKLAQGSFEDKMDESPTCVVAQRGLDKTSLMLPKATKLLQVQLVCDVSEEVIFASRATTQKELKVPTFASYCADLLLQISETRGYEENGR
jgi:3-deoxy-D-manno-octulosonic acid (KDO) 8-phosphate synthase